MVETMEPVQCGACGWAGRCNTDNVVICPKCGSATASDMIERVAIAAFRFAGTSSHAFSINWDHVRPEAKDYWRRLARASIEAMREPTGDMVEAVNGGHFDVYWSYESDGRPGDPADIFTAMIDAALVPPSEE